MKPIQKGDLSSEELKKRQSNGGKKSGETRRKKRDAREAARYILGLAAKGQVLDNLKSLGVEEDSRTNMEALQARLYTMAMGGNIEAYKTLMKMAGYEPEENRAERESVASDKRRSMELEAKLNALGQAPEGATMSVGMGNEDGANDVIIYMPKMLNEEDCQAEDDPDDESPAAEEERQEDS